MTVTGNDLAHALFTTGRAPGDQTLYGDASVWEWVHRVALIPAYIRQDTAGGLARSSLARSLDRSEKVVLSYSIGQAMTCIFAEQVLAIPYLLHHDRYAGTFGLTHTMRSRRRPDLFGYGPQGWVVAEAKGRSGPMPSNMTADIQAQKSSVALINGSAPALRFGCVASIPRKSSSLRIDAVDPIKLADEPEDFDMPLENYLRAYYLPLVRAYGLGENDGEDQTRSYARLNGIRIGLPTALISALAPGSRQAAELSALLPSINRADDRSIHLDNVSVEVDWDDNFRVDDLDYE